MAALILVAFSCFLLTPPTSDREFFFRLSVQLQYRSCVSNRYDQLCPLLGTPPTSSIVWRAVQYQLSCNWYSAVHVHLSSLSTLWIKVAFHNYVLFHFLKPSFSKQVGVRHSLQRLHRAQRSGLQCIQHAGGIWKRFANKLNSLYLQ